MDYLLLKWLHVLSSMLLFGTGIGSAFYALFTSLGRDARAVAAVLRLVVIADWCFTTPAVIFQPISGVYLARMAGFPLSTNWLAESMMLYGIAIACWLPVVWIQIVMRDLAQTAFHEATPLPGRYWRYLVLWCGLGSAAFFSLLAVLYLMVLK